MSQSNWHLCEKLQESLKSINKWPSRVLVALSSSGVFAVSEGHRSSFLSRCNHCWSSSPRPSDTFAGRSDAATPTADGATRRYQNAADNGGAHFHAAANKKAAFSVERSSDASLVRWQPLSSCSSCLDHNHTFCSSDLPTLIANTNSYQQPNQSHPRSTFRQQVLRAAVFLHPYSATRVCNSLH
jgi:hypothetical protein